MIWKSEIEPSYKNMGKLLIVFGLVWTVIPSIFTFGLLITGNPDFYWGSNLLTELFLLLNIVFGSIALGFVWSGFHFFVTYVKIYEDGIKIRKPVRLFQSKYIPFDLIEDIQIQTLPGYKGGLRISYIRIGGRNALLIPRHIKATPAEDALVIILKHGKPIQLRRGWVGDVDRARELMLRWLNFYKIRNIVG